MTQTSWITRDLFHSTANIWYHQCINLITDSELTLIGIIMDKDEMQNIIGRVLGSVDSVWQDIT